MKKKILLAKVVMSMVAYVALRRGGGEGDKAQTMDKGIVLDRIWIDHIPKNDRDVFNIFVAITEEPFGIFQATSQWKGSFELFRYEATDSEIRLVYGQTGEKEKVKVKAAKCNERGFDFCLQLDGASRGVKKYYSMEDWVIDGTPASRLNELEHLRTRMTALLAK